MKKVLPCIVFLLSLVFISCSDAPAADEVIIKAAEQALDAKGDAFIADTAISRIRFVGRGVGKSHAGSFKLSTGSISVEKNLVTGGSFIINILSMDLEDKGGIYDRKLYPHLMGEDFFEADKYNTAKFEITGIQPYKDSSNSSVVKDSNFLVSGNLTLKEVTHNISFPARIDITDNSLKATSNFVMNRKLWNMNYGSEKSLGNKFISEKVNIRFTLEAGRNLNQ
jgi:polyisoprenoid-binding protein YceI